MAGIGILKVHWLDFLKTAGSPQPPKDPTTGRSAGRRPRPAEALEVAPRRRPRVPFQPNPAAPPAVAPADRPADPRFHDLFVGSPTGADVILAGVPFDASVLGRKGARDGPTGIREAFRFLGTHDPRTDRSLADLRLHDAGDVAGLDAHGDDVLAAHATVRAAAGSLLAHGTPVVLLGGDHGLTMPHLQALTDHADGRVGIVVVDAHYDLRSYDVQPTSGTPFRRILEELDGRVRPENLVEVGIRPYANAAGLSHYARERGVHVVTADAVRSRGMEAVAAEALERAGDGVEHLWLSIDIDGLDQSIASGCSAPGAGGLLFPEVEHLVRVVAADPRCRGMDLLEVAPGLDPTGNTCRTAAQLVASFVGAACLP